MNRTAAPPSRIVQSLWRVLCRVTFIIALSKVVVLLAMSIFPLLGLTVRVPECIRYKTEPLAFRTIGYVLKHLNICRINWCVSIADIPSCRRNTCWWSRVIDSPLSTAAKFALLDPSHYGVSYRLTSLVLHRFLSWSGRLKYNTTLSLIRFHHQRRTCILIFITVLGALVISHSILYHTELHCTVLYCTVYSKYYTVVHCTTLHCTIM